MNLPIANVLGDAAKRWLELVLVPPSFHTMQYTPVPSKRMGDATKQDAFPPTRTDWIDGELGRGTMGRQNVNRHVMEAYAWPLKVYFLGTRDRWIGEPEDIVQGFFADRLGRPDYFNKWKASGKRLRHWLINGFCFYLKEINRDRSRGGKPASESAEPSYDDSAAADEMDRVWVQALVREALVEGEAACARSGLGDHWKIFLSHFYQDQPYERVASSFGVDSTRAAVMARTAKRKFQAALRNLVRQDGVGEESVDAEIEQLLTAVHIRPQRKIEGAQ